MLQCDPRNRSTYHSGQLKVTQRFRGGLQFLGSYTYGKSLDYGGSAASGAGAVGNPQTITNLDAGHGPSGFDVRHRAVDQLGLRAAVGTGPAWLERRACSARSSAAGSSAGISTSPTGRPFTVFMQNGVNNGAPSWPNRIGSGSSTTRPSTSGTTRATSSRRRPTPTATAAAAFSTARPRQLRHLAVEALHRGRPRERRVPLGRVQPVQPSRLRLPEPELRFADRRPNHVDRRRQPSMQFSLKLNF
jgi:hypothetical protein